MLGYSREETSIQLCHSMKASAFLIGPAGESCVQDKTGSHELARSRHQADKPEVEHIRFATSEGFQAQNYTVSVLCTSSPEQALIH